MSRGIRGFRAKTERTLPNRVAQHNFSRYQSVVFIAMGNDGTAFQLRAVLCHVLGFFPLAPIVGTVETHTEFTHFSYIIDIQIMLWSNQLVHIGLVFHSSFFLSVKPNLFSSTPSTITRKRLAERIGSSHRIIVVKVVTESNLSCSKLRPEF